MAMDTLLVFAALISPHLLLEQLLAAGARLGVRRPLTPSASPGASCLVLSRAGSRRLINSFGKVAPGREPSSVGRWHGAVWRVFLALRTARRNPLPGGALFCGDHYSSTGP
jgi:hypothetical protein